MISDASSQLPSGWATASLSALISSDGVFSDGDWVETKDQDPQGDVRLIQLADIGDGRYLNRSCRFLSSTSANELGCTFLERGDLLVARMPDPLGRACTFPGDTKRAVTVVDVCIIRTGSLGPWHRWLMYAVNSPQYRARVLALQRGSTRKRISRSNLAAIDLPLPPLPEQHRIVAEIEKHFTRLDAAVAALRRARANLKRYRAAVLKAACEGRLVPTEAALARAEGRGCERASALLERILKERRAKWEADQPAKVEASGKPPKDDRWKAKYKEPASPDFDGLPALPEGWVWATVDQLGANELNSITDGPFGSNLKTSHYTNSGPRVIRLQNIGDGDFIDAKAHISQEHFNTLLKHQVKAGDLVIAALGDAPPRACVVPSYIGPAIVKADCVRFAVHPAAAVSTYLNLALNANPTRVRVAHNLHGVGRQRLNLREIKEITVPLPPLPEQARIYADAELRLSVIHGLAQLLERGLTRAERLRQSILRVAFEGRLVPQNPADEPASVLLKRIRAERAAQPAAVRSSSPRRAKLRTVAAAAQMHLGEASQE